MKVILSCIGKFHHFDLARQLHSAGVLESIYTSYPRWKLKAERIPQKKIHTFPWLQTLYMAKGRIGLNNPAFSRMLGELARRSHDRWVATFITPCDVFVGLSGHNLRAGRRAKAMGAAWVCDRGSSHIQFQDRILNEEHRKWGITWKGIIPAVIAQELREYDEADVVSIPSRFVERTFISAGISKDKLRRIAYGVDLSRFYPVAKPDPKEFLVTFVGAVTLQKGVPYLIEAFRKLRHPRKKLRIIGALDVSMIDWMKQVGDPEIQCLGARPQPELKEYFSRSHVAVLPSVQEGLALVMAQSLACGCPIIASESTGAEDLISNNIEGIIVPARDSLALAQAMQMVADNPELRERLSTAALAKVKAIGGWDSYGRDYLSMLRELSCK